jgi:hypothetical protein
MLETLRRFRVSLSLSAVLVAVIAFLCYALIMGMGSTHSLTVEFHGHGVGSVVWDRGQSTIDGCASRSDDQCVVPFPATREMLFTAVAENGYEFVRWEGDCVGKAQTCLLKMDGDKKITITFEKER